jgi:hypothetical protein
VISRDGGTPAPGLSRTGHTWLVLLLGIRAVGDEPLVLSPTDPEAESANTCWFGASPHERLGASVEEVVTAFEEAAVRIRSQVAELGHQGTATFYVWHDEQAGQLRCSTGSRPPEGLPFDSEYRPTDDLRGIVAGFLADGEPGFVRFTDLKPVAEDDISGTYPPFAVWTFDVTAEPAHGRR